MGARTRGQAVEKVCAGLKNEACEHQLWKQTKENSEPLLDEAFQILSGCHHHAFDIYLQQAPQAKPPQPVEFLSLSKQRLNPHAPFALGLLIRFGLSIGFGFVKLFLEERAEDKPATFTGCAFALHWTGVRDLGIGAIDDYFLRHAPIPKGECLSLRTNKPIQSAKRIRLKWRADLLSIKRKMRQSGS